MGSSLTQSITATNAGPLISGTNNLIQFTIKDVAGNAATETYTVRIGQPPDISIVSITAGPYAYASGARVYYNNNGSNTGWFTVTARITDTGGGLQYARFPTTTSSGVFSNNVTTSGLYPWGYVFTPTATFSATVEVTAGNSLNQWEGAPFTVTRDLVAPGVSVNVPTRVTTGTIPVSWTSSDGLSGPTHVYTVSVMTDTGPLQLWLAGTTAFSGNFAGQLGHKYTFVVTTTDRVSNTGQGVATGYTVQATKYYYIGSSRVAMRQTNAVSSTVTYLHTDHLGTVSIATNQSQTVLARTLNMPYGGVRWTSGTMPTDWGFTGQKEPIGTGLVYLHARYYASWVGRFVSADTIVPEPGNPQNLNRYTYALNSPLRYTDPTGHCSGPLAFICDIVQQVGISIGRSGDLGKALVVGGHNTMVAANRFKDTLGTEILRPAANQAYAYAIPLNAANNANDAPYATSGKDLTAWLMQTMVANATGEAGKSLKENLASGEPFKGAGALNAWVELVRPGGYWDYKPEIFRALGENIQLGGHKLKWDVPGNIHFGFLGRAIGISRADLLSGAGFAQIWAETARPEWWYTMFDDPKDRIAILAGMDLFDKYGLDFTPEEFQRILNLYAQYMRQADE